MLTATVDFLEFTVPQVVFYDLVGLLPGGLTARDSGWRGYQCSALVASGKGFVGWSPDREDMGVHVSLGGQALGIFAGLDKRWEDLAGVLSLIRDEWKGHVTRIDVAFDDKEGVLDLERMRQEVKAGNFTTRWKGGHDRWGWGNQAGESLYFGRKGSDAFLCCYDKKEERLAKGHEVKEDHWVRVELRLRRKRADAVAQLWQEVSMDAPRVFEHLAGVLRGYLEFKVPNATDSNKRRWAAAPWWSAFLGHVEKARLTLEKVVRTVQNVMSWVSAQVAPSLALLETALGKDRAWAFVFAETEDGRARWGPRHRAILKASGVAV